MESVFARFKANGSCVEWSGRSCVQGYGRFRWYDEATKRPVQWLAHRWTWTQVYGPIPGGLHVLHSCDNPLCVDVAHLRLGTNAENIQDKLDRRRHARHAATACAKGHPYSDDNLVMRAGGARGCRTCNRDKAARHRKRSA